MKSLIRQQWYKVGEQFHAPAQPFPSEHSNEPGKLIALLNRLAEAESKGGTSVTL